MIATYSALLLALLESLFDGVHGGVVVAIVRRNKRIGEW
jgi:hypothetical protein